TEATASRSRPFAATMTIVSPAATPPAGTVRTSWLSSPFVTDRDATSLTKRGPLGAAATTAVGAEVAAVAAAELVAVTTTRKVEPTSAVASTYVDAVTPGVALAEPAPFAPVTMTRIDWPTSAETSVYDDPVPTSTQPGEQRCQR